MTKISQYQPGLKKSIFWTHMWHRLKWYISVYMPVHYVSNYFDSENKSFIEFTPLGYQTGVFQRLGLFELSKLTKNPGGSDCKILFTYAALSSSCCVQYIFNRGNYTFKLNDYSHNFDARMAHDFIFKIRF